MSEMILRQSSADRVGRIENELDDVQCEVIGIRKAKLRRQLAELEKQQQHGA